MVVLMILQGNIAIVLDIVTNYSLYFLYCSQVTNLQPCLFCRADGSDTTQYLTVSKPKHKDAFSAKEKFIHVKVGTKFCHCFYSLFYCQMDVENKVGKCFF